MDQSQNIQGAPQAAANPRAMDVPVDRARQAAALQAASAPQPAAPAQPAAAPAPQPAAPVPQPEAPAQRPAAAVGADGPEPAPVTGKRLRGAGDAPEARPLGNREDIEQAWQHRDRTRQDKAYTIIELGLSVERLEFMRRAQEPTSTRCGTA